MQRERQVLSSPEVSEAHWNLVKGIDLLLSFDISLYLFVWAHVQDSVLLPGLFSSILEAPRLKLQVIWSSTRDLRGWRITFSQHAASIQVSILESRVRLSVKYCSLCWGRKNGGHREADFTSAPADANSSIRLKLPYRRGVFTSQEDNSLSVLSQVQASDQWEAAD